MQKAIITAIGTANPPHQVTQHQTAAFMAKALKLEEADRRKLNILYKATHIDSRYTVLEDYTRTENFDFYPNNGGSFPTTSQRMFVYQQHASNLAIESINECRKVRNFDVKEITHLITISCTGMYAPGIDIELIEKLGLNTSVHRFGINFMGCYAAFNGLKLADAICKSDPGAKVLMVAVELCTIHLQHSSKEDDLTAGALFADGASAVLIEPEKEGMRGFVIDKFYCDLASNGKKDMAWQINDFGFEMRLSSYVPDLLKFKIQDCIRALIPQSQEELEKMDWFAIHPGGKKILEVIEKNLPVAKEKLKYSYDILRNYGNMSSVTILFVFKKIMENVTARHHLQNILCMAFGPGLTIESALLQIKQ